MPFIAPIVAAIGSAIGAVAGAIAGIGSFLGGLGFFGKLLISIGLNVASALIQKALAKKQKPPPGGVQFERQYGADVPRSVACGLVGVAAHDTYINTYNSSNKYLQQIYTLSDYPSDGLSRVAINGEWATLGAEDPEKGRVVTSGKFANLIWIKFLDGRQTEANAYLVENSNPEGRWTENHIGVGETAILVSMTYDQEKNAQFPDFFFEYRGARLYDWRKDSSIGGSGSHRWDDPSTHEYTANPIVIEYNYRRGFRVNGDLFCGMDMAASDLPFDRWTAAANICDETVGDEKRYRCSILLDCMSTHGDNIESIALSCGAMTVDGVDGTWPIVGSDQPTVLTFTDDDLITTVPVKYRAKRSQSELVNSVSGNFPDPGNLWSMVGYETQISETALALDRRTRDLAIDFPQVPSGRQAAQLAAIYLYENRYEATATVTLRPRFQVLEPGDWVRWNSKRYGDKVYIVTETQLASLESDGPRNIQVSLQERDGAIYDAVTPPPITVPTPPGAPVYLGEVQDFTVVAVNIAGADGRLAPAIRASWSAINDETVAGVEVQYFPTADASSVIYRTIPRGTTVALLAEGIVANTEYTVKTRLVTDPARTVTWSAGATVTTDNVASDRDVYLNNIKGDAYEIIQNLQGQLNDLSARMEMIAAGAADATGTNIDLHTVSKRFQNATAVALREMTASIEQNADGLTAQAAILDAVQASVGEVSADGLRKIEVTAGTGDVVARLTDMVRASIADDWVEAGTVTEVGFTGGDPEQPFSRIVQYANQFVFTDGTATAIPVVFDGGVAYLDEVRVRQLIADEVEVIGKFNAGTVLEDGTIITSLISANTLVANDSGSFDSFNAGGETNLTKVSINCPNPNPSFVFIEYSLSAQAYRSSGGAVTTTVNLVRIGASGTTILDSAIAVNSSTSGAVTKATGKQFMMDDGGEVDSVYEIQVTCTASNKTFPQTTSGYAKLIWWQR